MSWAEFKGHIDAMNRQQEAEQVAPDSWDGADKDQWWVQARADRERKRGG